ncbi:MAG: sensor histidine kinase [Treponema sp.]|mgnify:FL=1|jgi:hypothetical protein|nr:sensor histidine kinase [Treponema sp.]
MHYTICDLLADLTQNAVEADASKVTVEFLETDTELKVYIRDNGKGMDAETLKRVSDPFFTDGIKHPNRKVGLGIPFLIQTTTETGGEWNIDSVPNKGTTVFARFDLINIDTPPIGDVVGFFRQILLFNSTIPEYDLEIIRKKQGKLNCSYKIMRTELIEALGSINDVQALSLMRTYLESLESAE